MTELKLQVSFAIQYLKFPGEIVQLCCSRRDLDFCFAFFTG